MREALGERGAHLQASRAIRGQRPASQGARQLGNPPLSVQGSAACGLPFHSRALAWRSLLSRTAGMVRQALRRFNSGLSGLQAAADPGSAAITVLRGGTTLPMQTGWPSHGPSRGLSGRILSCVGADPGVYFKIALHCRLSVASGWWQLAGQALELSLRASGVDVKHHIIFTPSMDSNATILDALAAVKVSTVQGSSLAPVTSDCET